MKSEKETTIIPAKTYTKTEYAKAYGMSRPTVDSKIKSKLLKSIEVNGAVLIIA